MKNTLYISDLDGTLLASNSRLSEKNYQRLLKIIDDPKINFTFATARGMHSVKKIFPDLPLKLPCIAGNGAFIRELKSGKIINAFFLKKKDKEDLQAYLDPMDLTPIYYIIEEETEKILWHTGEESEGTKHYFNRFNNRTNLYPLDKKTLKEKLNERDVFCINIIDSHEKLKSLYEHLKAKNKYYLVFYQELYRPEWWLCIYPKETSKGNAALLLKKMFGFDELVVFGDEKNDIPLFEIADKCYAVENAIPQLKEIATDVIASNDDSGVLHFLENLKR